MLASPSSPSLLLPQHIPAIKAPSFFQCLSLLSRMHIHDRSRGLTRSLHITATHTATPATVSGPVSPVALPHNHFHMLDYRWVAGEEGDEVRDRRKEVKMMAAAAEVITSLEYGRRAAGSPPNLTTWNRKILALRNKRPTSGHTYNTRYHTGGHFV